MDIVDVVARHFPDGAIPRAEGSLICDAVFSTMERFITLRVILSIMRNFASIVRQRHEPLEVIKQMTTNDSINAPFLLLLVNFTSTRLPSPITQLTSVISTTSQHPYVPTT
jgi:hypothetical protein